LVQNNSPRLKSLRTVARAGDNRKKKKTTNQVGHNASRLEEEKYMARGANSKKKYASQERGTKRTFAKPMEASRISLEGFALAVMT